MARKRWTPQTDITDSLIRIREKKKWQLGFRRYVIEKKPSEAYAPYFGLDIETLREWFTIQFTEDLNWDNFGKAWQFDHIIPTSYFDFTNVEDLRLCWNFINIHVAKLEEGKPLRQIDPLSTKAYFKSLADKTGYTLCLKMLIKIEQIEQTQPFNHSAIEQFLIQRSTDIEILQTLSFDEFTQLNQGANLKDLLLEREILRKFSSSQ